MNSSTDMRYQHIINWGKEDNTFLVDVLLT